MSGKYLDLNLPSSAHDNQTADKKVLVSKFGVGLNMSFAAGPLGTMNYGEIVYQLNIS